MTGLASGGGAGPFKTWRRLNIAGEIRLWLARNHRKGVGITHAPRAFWQTPAFNLCIAAGFGIGSGLFVIGAMLSLGGVARWELSAYQINLIYGIGSVFFTLAGFLQLFQAANAGAALHSATAPPQRHVIGWQPDNLGWLSSAVQFIGTLLFNINTFDALGGAGTWLQQDLTLWAPDFAGSVLFLAAGYLAMLETCHRWWAWQPRSLAWWIVAMNMLGCCAFMASASLAFVLPTDGAPLAGTASIVFTCGGAICFLVGAGLAAVEAVLPPG